MIDRYHKIRWFIIIKHDGLLYQNIMKYYNNKIPLFT